MEYIAQGENEYHFSSNRDDTSSSQIRTVEMAGGKKKKNPDRNGLKDYALPNSSWSGDMMDQFNKFTAMSEDGTWRRIPSHRRVEESAPGKDRCFYALCLCERASLL
ncbi:UNVERIFIED_CONTAM: hypothetical protein K2H54_026398 [Gekko kuhli]